MTALLVIIVAHLSELMDAKYCAKLVMQSSRNKGSGTQITHQTREVQILFCGPVCKASSERRWLSCLI